MPPAKTGTSRPSRPSRPGTITFREPAALQWLSSSLDAAQQALTELRADAGRDLSQGARDLHNDLRAFISSARRDTSTLAKALQRDFEHAQKQLADGTRAAAESRAKTTIEPASRQAAGKPRRFTAGRASSTPAASSAQQKTPNATSRRRKADTPTAASTPKASSGAPHLKATKLRMGKG